MRRPLLLALVLLAVLAFAGCPTPEPVVIYVEIPADPEPPAEPAPPEEPAWQPEPWHIYVFDSTDTMIFEEVAYPESTYRLRLQCWQLQCELQTRDYPEDPWRCVGGGFGPLPGSEA